MCVAVQLPKFEVTISDFNVREVTCLWWASVIFFPVWWQTVQWYGRTRKVKRCFEYNIKTVISHMCRLWFFTSYMCKWRPGHITRFLSHRHNVVYIQCWKVENIELKYVFGIQNSKLFWNMVPGVHVSVVHSVVGVWVLFTQHWCICRNVITYKWSLHCMSAEIHNGLVKPNSS